MPNKNLATPFYQSDRVTLYNADCLDVLRGMPDTSVDSIVTDPPYGLSFMGKKWDYDVPRVAVWMECLRVLKPGGHLLAFAGTRTQHRMCCKIEDAGFEIRDMIAWVYGSGFPKSHNLKDEWRGWGTALKPAMEPITVARKPLEGTVAANVLEWGTGAVNVEECRVPGDDHASAWDRPVSTNIGHGSYISDGTQHVVDISANKPTGRWPANLIHDGSDEVVGGFPKSGNKSGKATVVKRKRNKGWCNSSPGDGVDAIDNYGDSGSAARFFYCAKASKADRGENQHPTVKPTTLMRYLCRLVTPPGGIVLDPFTGSGSTGKAAAAEGFRFIGIEIDAGYCEIAKKRIMQAEEEFASAHAGEIAHAQ